MLISSEGIVVQSIKYGESSAISHVISKEKGLLSVISSRPKSKKNRTANYFQPLSAIQFVCYANNKADIFRIKEVSFSKHINQRQTIAIDAIRFFLAEFLNKAIKEKEQNFELYSFLKAQLTKLYSENSEVATFTIDFLLDFMNICGIQPDLNPNHLYFNFQEGASSNNKPQHLDYISKHDFELWLYRSTSTKLNKIDRHNILNQILKYYDNQLHENITNFKSKAVLEIIFN